MSRCRCELLAWQGYGHRSGSGLLHCCCLATGESGKRNGCFSQAEAVEQEHIQHPRQWPEQQSSPGRLRNQSAAADPPPKAAVEAAAQAAGEAAGGYRLEQRGAVAEGRQRRRMYPAGLKDAGAVTAGPAPWVAGGDGCLPAYEAAAGVLRAPCGPGPRDGFMLRQLSQEERQKYEQTLKQEKRQRVPIRRPRLVPPVLPEVAERVAEEKEVRPSTIIVPSLQPRQRSFSAAASFPRPMAEEGGDRGKPGKPQGWGRLRQLLHSGRLGRQWGVTYES